MNFIEAVKKCLEGEKIKRGRYYIGEKKEYDYLIKRTLNTGFAETSGVFVALKSGHALLTGDYLATDWEEDVTLISFLDAIEYAKAGFKIRRYSWSKGIYLRIIDGVLTYEDNRTGPPTDIYQNLFTSIITNDWEYV